MLRKLAALLGACTAVLTLQAQDSATAEKSSLNISGFVDAYFRYNFSGDYANNYTSFTNSQNSFEFGMASIKFDKSFGKVGFVADLGFGQRAKEFAYNDDGITAAVKQAYITYAPTDNLTFSAGSWATHVGYELVDPQLNRNYSMSYMFSYGPFTHTGIKADFKFGNTGFMLGVANPTDFRTTNVAPKFLLGQFSTGSKDEKLKLFVNYVGGKYSDTSRMGQVDAVVTYGLSDKFSLGYNGTIAGFREKDGDSKFESAGKWWGSALYLNFDPLEKLGLTLRSEYFSDDDGLNVFSGVGGGSLFANTLSANIRLGALTLIPELRFESADKAIYTDGKEGASKTTATALMAAVFAF